MILYIHDGFLADGCKHFWCISPRFFSPSDRLLWNQFKPLKAQGGEVLVERPDLYVEELTYRSSVPFAQIARRYTRIFQETSK